MRSELGDAYVDRLFRVWDGRVKAEADLCCYWFEKARALIESGTTKRAGLLATQGIRGGANREALKRIKESGNIFFAESDRDWILEGANVHVSMVGFDDGTEETKTLDGSSVQTITAQLTTGISLHTAHRMAENLDLAFMGITPAGEFDLDFETGKRLLLSVNPNGRPSSDVLRPYLNGKDLNQRARHQWTIDFGVDRSLESAAQYESAFEYLLAHVKPERDKNNREAYRLKWWLYAEPRPAMRSAFARLDRYLGTCMVAKHRVFVWIPAVCLPANVVIVFATGDDFVFGLLHSRLHLVWASAQGTQLEDRPRYTPTTCFETFPFPKATEEQRKLIAEAAAELDRLRNTWVNPTEWTREETLTFPGSVEGPWARYVTDADERGIGTVHYRRRVAKDEGSAKELAKRTLTNLYNSMPAWLRQAHQKLDEAVFAAYGWAPSLSDEEILARLLELNLRIAGATAP